MSARTDAIELLLERLRSHPELRFEQNEGEGGRWLRIEAPNERGFPVTLEDDGDEWTVYYGEGGHSHFDEAEEALEHVGFALSGDCRLIETWRGNVLQKAELQQWTGRKWKMVSIYGLLLSPFWRRRTRLILQNDFIKRASNL